MTPTPTPAPASVPPAPALSPGVTLDGSTVTVVGQGRSQSDPFELPAGSATMTITACSSNQVMPFITLVDGTGQSVGLIVDPEKVLNNLAGGTYAVSAQANPDCIWKVVIAPAVGGAPRHPAGRWPGIRRVPSPPRIRSRPLPPAARSWARPPSVGAA